MIRVLKITQRLTKDSIQVLSVYITIFIQNQYLSYLYFLSKNLLGKEIIFSIVQEVCQYTIRVIEKSTNMLGAELCQAQLNLSYVIFSWAIPCEITRSNLDPQKNWFLLTFSLVYNHLSTKSFILRLLWPIFTFCWLKWG